MSTTIETITVTRPMKVIAYTMCFLSVFLLVGAVTSSDWVNSGAWREGLFASCVEKGAATPLPFEMSPEMGCFRGRSAGYIRGTAALLIIALLTDFFGTLLTGLGLRSTDPNKKYKYYRVAIYSLLVAVLVLFLAVIIYPVSFSKDLAQEKNNPPLDGFDITHYASRGDIDLDNDGIPDAVDNDDDNDGVPDDEDTDDDNDGIPDHLDTDDDNDGIPDDEEDVDLEDSDGDGTPDSEDLDDDNDGVPDNIDTDDDNDGVADVIEDPDAVNVPDTDGDNIADDVDDDIDGDGILNTEDDDDDGDGVDDEDDMNDAGDSRTFSWGFGYGCSWACLIFIFISVVLLICDRESEEIFYKERPVEEEGGEEGEEEEEA